MPRWIRSSESLTGYLQDLLYNSYDTVVTGQVLDSLLPRIAKDSCAELLYHAERVVQGPAMTMQLRGVRLDYGAMRPLIRTLKAEGKDLRKKMDEYVRPYREGREAEVKAELEKAKRDSEDESLTGRERQRARFAIKRAEKALVECRGFSYGKALEPSTQQIQKFLYGEVGLKKERNRDGKVSADKTVLARIARKYPKWTDFCNTILDMRDKEKQIEKLEVGPSPDGRMRCCINVGATETDRTSSNEDPFGDGTNMQNWDRRLRVVVVPDEGWILVNADLAQADSRGVAYLSGDEGYIRAHEEGNVHVAAGRAFWPELAWTGDSDRDKKLMKQTPVPWIRQPDPEPGQDASVGYYDIAKRGQHGGNFMMSDRGMAHLCGCSVAVAAQMQDRYYSNFPGIPEWHQYIRAQIREFRELISPFARRRQFFGRRWEDSTVREAVAHLPQHITGWVTKLGMWRVWKSYDPDRIQLLLEGHDAGLYQVRTEDLEAAIELIIEAMTVRVPVVDFRGTKRTMVIPVEVQTGPNWRDC